MRTPPSLGIAVPSFGDGPFLGDMLRSLQALTIPFEAVIQDGGSPPATLDRIERAVAGDDRFRLEVEPDRGQSDAINRAVSALVDRHVAVTWVNTDDVVHPRGVEAALQRLVELPRTPAVYGDYLTIDEHGLVRSIVRPPRRASRFLLVYGWNYVPGVATVVRSEAWRSVGGLDETLHYAMDYDLWIRLSEMAALRKVDVPLMSFREHSGSKTVADAGRSRAEDRSVALRHQRLPSSVARGLRLATKTALVAYRRVGAVAFVQRTD